MSRQDLYVSTDPQNDAGIVWRALRAYLPFILAANALWEVAQIPLYTLWKDGTAGEIIFALVHCTAGDLIIAGATVGLALIVNRSWTWPAEGRWPVAATAIVLALSYTIFSEWLNVDVRATWTYTSTMPRLPLLGTGLSPLAQWIIVPLAGFWWTYRRYDVDDGRRL